MHDTFYCTEIAWWYSGFSQILAFCSFVLYKNNVIVESKRFTYRMKHTLSFHFSLLMNEPLMTVRGSRKSRQKILEYPMSEAKICKSQRTEDGKKQKALFSFL